MIEGKLTVITGCMFAGKTNTLIDLVGKEKYRKRDLICFKPAQDNRYSTTQIVSHNQIALDALVVKTASDIEEVLQTKEAIKTSVAIEEGQFFDPSIAPLVSTLSNDGFRIFVAGLALDSFGHPFGPMPELLAYADEIIQLHAQCVICTKDATRTFRKIKTQEQVHVGGADDYEPMCKKCWREN